MSHICYRSIRSGPHCAIHLARACSLSLGMPSRHGVHARTQSVMPTLPESLELCKAAHMDKSTHMDNMHHHQAPRRARALARLKLHAAGGRARRALGATALRAARPRGRIALRCEGPERCCPLLLLLTPAAKTDRSQYDAELLRVARIGARGGGGGGRSPTPARLSPK